MSNTLLLKNYNFGFSTLEMLIALSLITASISTVVLVAFGSQSAVLDSQRNSEALYKAREMMESGRASTGGNFSSLQAIATSSDAGYEKSLTVYSDDEFTKRVTSSVVWKTDHGRNGQVNLTTTFTDWQNALSGNTCNAPLSGDWHHPAMVSYLFGQDMLKNNSTTTSISDIQERGQKLYASLTVSATKSDPKFFIFNISQEGPPVLAGSINNATSTVSGISAFAVAGNYAYIASSRAISASNGFGQLQIIDIHDSASPQLIKTYKISNVAGTSGQGIGSSIFYTGGYVYLGLTKTGSGPEFIIVDVRDPLNPAAVGSYSVGNTVNRILVKGSFAYVAHPTDSISQPSEQLTILAISDPANPKRVSGFHALDNQGNGKSLFTAGNYLYFGRTITGSANPELYIIDNLDPVVIAGPQSLGSQKISNSVNDIVGRGNLIFLITNNQLQIWNRDDLAHLVLWASLSFSGSSGTVIRCAGNQLYISSVTASGTGYLSVLSAGP